MTIVARPEILTSLNSMREDVQRQVDGLDRYRALKAIEQTIADFPTLEDVAQSLSDIRDRVRRQLDETREYRALRTIERIMPELSEVLALLAEQVEINDGSPDTELVPASDDMTASDSSQPHIAEGPQRIDESPTGAAAFLGIRELVAEPIVAPGDAERERSAPDPIAAGFELAHELRAEPEAHSDQAVISKVIPSLADSVAQLLAQSAAPPARHDPAEQQPYPDRSDTSAASRADRAA